MKKSERVAVRMSGFTRTQLELAANARQQSLSEFMRDAARRSARRTLGAELGEGGVSRGKKQR